MPLLRLLDEAGVDRDRARCPAGWLLVIGLDAARLVSELIVLDAADVAAGPVAAADLPGLVPHGLHGAWVPRDDLAPSASIVRAE